MVPSVFAERWLDLATISNVQSYQIDSSSLATNKVDGYVYLIIESRYHFSNGKPSIRETVALREADCKKSAGNIIIQRENGREDQVPFVVAGDNLPYKILKVVCGTYESVKKLLDQ